MIKGTFRLGGDLIDAVIRDKELLFYDTATGVMTTVEGLRISKAGVLKEHPDLKTNPDWKKISLDRLKDHIRKFNTEMARLNYVKEELTKFGYEAKYLQKAGWRPQKFK